MLMSFPGKGSILLELTVCGGVELMKYMPMSFSEGDLSLTRSSGGGCSQHRKRWACTGTRHPWCPAQHRQQSATRTRREEGRLLDPDSKPQGHRPVGPHLRPLRGSHHIHGARVGRTKTNHGSTRPGEKNARHGRLLTIIAAGPPPLTSPHLTSPHPENET